MRSSPTEVCPFTLAAPDKGSRVRTCVLLFPPRYKCRQAGTAEEDEGLCCSDNEGPRISIFDNVIRHSLDEVETFSNRLKH